MDAFVKFCSGREDRVSFRDMAAFCTSQESGIGEVSHPCGSMNLLLSAHTSMNHSLTQPVAIGGPLFHAFVVMFGAPASRRVLSLLCDEFRTNDTAFPVQSEGLTALFKKERVAFCSFLITTGSRRGIGMNQQLFYYQMVASFRGLSRSGSDVMKLFACGLSRRTFDAFRKSHVHRVNLRLRCDKLR